MKLHPSISPLKRVRLSIWSADLTRVVWRDRILAGLAACVMAVAAQAGSPVPIVPKEKIVLFNGADLEGFETWIPETGREDPDRVFTVVDNIDGAPAIRASGQHFGGLLTRDSFADYKLIVEFRWGLATWNPRAFKSRDNGILLHCQGQPGNASAAMNSPWMHSVEYQIIEGGTGDIILVSGYDPETKRFNRTPLTVKVKPGMKDWDPNGVPTEFERGRINWQYRDPAWKDVLGVRGPRDVEKPVGEWNRIEILCRGGDVDYYLNGVKVNEGRNGGLKEGRILLQSEGAEIYFRKMELHPLDQ